MMMIMVIVMAHITFTDMATWQFFFFSLCQNDHYFFLFECPKKKQNWIFKQASQPERTENTPFLSPFTPNRPPLICLFFFHRFMYAGLNTVFNRYFFLCRKRIAVILIIPVEPPFHTHTPKKKKSDPQW